MIRRLFHIIAAASLLLCIVAAMMWGRSYGGLDIAYRDGNLARSSFRVGLESSLGRVILFWSAEPPEWTSLIQFQRTPSVYVLALDPASEQYKRRTFFGYGLGWWYTPDGLTWHLLLPWWIVLVLTALLPVRWYILWRGRWRREYRRRMALCPNCGYDLRASSGNCPECGMPPTSPAEMA
jgi:hypothetical protein